MQGASSKTIHWDRKLLCWLPQFQRCSIMGDSWDGGRCMFTAWFYSRLVSSHRTSPLIFFPPTLCSETLSLYALSFKKACTAGGTKLNFDWLALLIPILLSTIIILINQWQRESCLHNRMFISNEYCTEFNERALYQMAFLPQLKNKKSWEKVKVLASYLRKMDWTFVSYWQRCLSDVMPLQWVQLTSTSAKSA